MNRPTGIVSEHTAAQRLGVSWQEVRPIMDKYQILRRYRFGERYYKASDVATVKAMLDVAAGRTGPESGERGGEGGA